MASGKDTGVWAGREATWQEIWAPVCGESSSPTNHNEQPPRAFLSGVLAGDRMSVVARMQGIEQVAASGEGLLMQRQLGTRAAEMLR